MAVAEGFARTRTPSQELAGTHPRIGVQVRYALPSSPPLSSSPSPDSAVTFYSRVTEQGCVWSCPRSLSAGKLYHGFAFHALSEVQLYTLLSTCDLTSLRTSPLSSPLDRALGSLASVRCPSHVISVSHALSRSVSQVTYCGTLLPVLFLSLFPFSVGPYTFLPVVFS